MDGAMRVLGCALTRVVLKDGRSIYCNAAFVVSVEELAKGSKLVLAPGAAYETEETAHNLADRFAGTFADHGPNAAA